MNVKLGIEGISKEEHARLLDLVASRGPREHVVLKFAALMAEDNEQSGARWIVRKLLALRAARGRPM